MEHFKLHSLLPLQLFADGAAGDTGVMAPDAGVQGVKQEASADTARLPETTASDPDAEFDRLIRGQFKDQYNARVRDIVQKRLKGQQKTLEQYQALEPSLSLLADKYGVEAKDLKALGEAIARDDSLRQQAPAPVPGEHQQQVRQQYEQWLDQERQARELYPSLDLRREVQNPRFRELLRAGAQVDEAYLVVHRDEVLPAVMRYSADAAREKLANRIAANDVRPPENAMSAQSSAVVKQDVARMTKAQRQDIIRRVQKGEIIKF